jgi:hypothetical protein
MEEDGGGGRKKDGEMKVRRKRKGLVENRNVLLCV